ncbi:MAG TPA: Ig-like domain repeat protein [Bryobacteraceae bacterium]|nr:Ig-like domain repeat protein [Bryobacteraceae bacterium]
MGRHIVSFSRSVFFSCLLLALSSSAFAQCVGNVCTSSGSISITNGTPVSYPYTISVSGLTGSVTKVTLTLHGVNIPSNPFNEGYLLQSPSPSLNLDFWSAGCGGTNGTPVNVDLTFDDAAANTVPNVCSSGGTFRPTEDFADTFPSIGPIASGDAAPPHGTGMLSKFNGLTGTALNGTWKLFIASQAGGNTTGTITSWSLTFTTSGAGHPTATTINSNTPNPTFTAAPNGQVTFAVSVNTTDSSGPATNGTVTIHDVNTNTDLGSGSISSSGTANIPITIPTEGNHDIYAIYGGGTGFAGSQASNHVTQTVSNHATNPSGTTFCNPGTITIPTGGIPQAPVAATPFPSSIVLGSADGRATPPSPGPGIIQKLTVSLNNINYGAMDALGFILVSPGPNPKAYEFLSEAGGQPSNNVVSITLDDDAAGTLSRTTEPSSGSYKPASFVDQAPFGPPSNPDPYPAGAPASFDSALTFGNVATLRQEFAGRGGDGTWQLFVGDRGNTGNVGTLSGTNPSGGWCLTFTMQPNGTATSVTLTSTKNPATPSDAVTITATISPNVGNAGTVTFTDGVNTLASNVAVSGSKATFVINAGTLIEGTHHIIAEYSGTNSGTIFGPSTGTINQRIDNVTGVPTISGPVYTYCNTGTITFPGGSAAQGPASPYPSNIFVSSLPGTVDATTLTLKSFTANVPQFLDSLVVGPGGTNLDFFSSEGGLTHVGPFDLTFDDTAATGLTTTAGTPTAGSFKPTSANSTHTYPACPSNATDCQSPAIGPPAPTTGYNFAQPGGTSILGNNGASGVFGGTTSSTFNGNGTWSLFQFVNNEENPDGTEAGWCVNLKENLPDISLTATPMTHSPSIFTRGQPASFTITATNNGPGPTGFPTLTITDTLAAGLTFTSGSGTGWSCSATGTPQVVTCTQANPIVAGSSSAVTINVTVGTSTADSINNSATSDTGAFPNGTGGDGTSNNNTTANNGIQVAGTLLTISKSHTDPFTQGQTNATYSITVKNTGADGSSTAGHAGATLGTVMVTDAMPNAFTITAVNGGTDWTCTSQTTVNCTLKNSLAVGSTTGAITVTVTVSNTANTISGALINTANLIASTDQIGTADPTCTNHFSCFNDPTNIKQVPTQMNTNANTTPQSAMVNTAFANALAVTVLDAGNTPVAGVPITFTAPGTSPTGTFAVTANCTATACTNINTNSSGVATASTFTANGTIGSYNVHTTSTAFGATKDFALTNTDTPATVTSVSSTAANGAYTTAAVIPVTVTFSKAVNVTGTPQLTLNSGAVVNYTSGTGTATLTFTYTVAAGQNANPLDEASATALALNGGTIKNPSTLDATLTLPAPGSAGSLGANKTIVVDTTAPTVTSVSSTTADGTYGTGTVIPITVTFSEAVNVTGTPQLALNSGGTASYSSGSGTSTLTFTYTVGAGQSASRLDYTATNALSLNGGTIKDAATNVAVLTLPAPGTAGSLGANKNIVIDTTGPTVTNVTSTTPNGTYGVGTVIPITVTFSKTVNVTGTPQLALNSGGTASYSSGSGTATLTFTYTVGAGQNSSHLDYTSTGALSLNGGTIKDIAGNVATLTLPSPGAAGSLAANTNLVIDTTAPTVTNVSSTTANGTYGVGAVINITVTFSKVVNVVTPPASQVLLPLNSGGTAIYSSGSGSATLNFTYTVSAGQNSAHLDYTSTSALTLSGPATIKDTAGNNAVTTLPATGGAGSLAGNTNIVIDTNTGTVTSVTTTTANGTYGPGAVINVTVNFSKAMTVTGTPVIALNSGGSASYSSGSGTASLAFTYTVGAGQNAAHLDYTSTGALSLNGGTIKDSGGTAASLTLPAPGGAGSLGGSSNIVIDTTAPTVTNVSSTTANGTYGAGAVIAITVGFSENVTVTGTPLLALNSGGTASYSSGSGTGTLTFTYTVGAGQFLAARLHLDGRSVPQWRHDQRCGQ